VGLWISIVLMLVPPVLYLIGIVGILMD
jgi:hypothetical protein